MHISDALTLRLKVGEQALAFYKATNNSDEPVTGNAIFNVSPELAASIAG